jgi:hypothetical protein
MQCLCLSRLLHVMIDWLIDCGSFTSPDSIIHMPFVVIHSFTLLSLNHLTSIISIRPHSFHSITPICSFMNASID